MPPRVLGVLLLTIYRTPAYVSKGFARTGKVLVTFFSCSQEGTGWFLIVIALDFPEFVQPG